MSLIPAAESDLEAVVALVNRAYRGTEGWTNEGEYLGGQRTDLQTLRNDLAAEPEARLLTMRDDDDGPLLGVVWVEPSEDDAWYLGMLTVRPDLQDQGVGRRLSGRSGSVRRRPWRPTDSHDGDRHPRHPDRLV